jgi:hypothetical protein
VTRHAALPPRAVPAISAAAPADAPMLSVPPPAPVAASPPAANLAPRAPPPSDPAAPIATRPNSE